MDRVDEQIGQDTGHLAAVDLDRDRLDPVADDPYTVLLGQGVGARERVADKVVDRHPGGVQGEDAGLDAGQFEEVADHAAHALDLRADTGVVDARVVDHTVLQGLCHGLEPGEWGAQVVGDPGDQFAPGVLQGPLPLPGCGELRAGGGEFAAQFGEFGGGCGGGRGETPLVAEDAGGLGQGSAAADDAAAERERHPERDDRRNGADHRHHPQVVVGQEHGPGDQHGSGEHRCDRDGGDHGQRHRHRTVAQQPQDAHAEQPGSDRAEGRVSRDEESVTQHDRLRPAPGEGRSGSPRPTLC